MNAASHVESPISGRKLCAFALAAALALMAGAQFAPAHYAWAEDEPAATAQADATLPDAAPLEEAPPEVAALAPIENAPHLDLKDGSILWKRREDTRLPPSVRTARFQVAAPSSFGNPAT